MAQSNNEFLRALAEAKFSEKDRSVGLLWYMGLENPNVEFSVGELGKILEEAGFAKMNLSRAGRALQQDRRIARGSGEKFKININSRKELGKIFLPLTNSKPVPPSDSILPRAMFDGTRGYIEKVVAQINASYDASLFDCCAVMCRRLLETLIIEVYEHFGIADDLKDTDGNFKMFSGLLACLDNETQFNFGRDTKRGLKRFKDLGDRSAHNRRFNARRNDIDKIQEGLRVASEELLHLAALI